MNPEARYRQHLDDIKRIAAFVARRAHLSADDCDEFVQVVCVRLLEDDYAIIRKFQGRSSFTTYLTPVIKHLYQEWRTREWGKWRPSAEAKRLGDRAITLERLLTRDGYTFSEAAQMLTTPAGAEYTIAELEALYVRLPLRNPRPMLVSDEVAPDVVAVESDADDRIESRDRERIAARCAAVLDAALDRLDPEERLILQFRFWHGRKVPEIARMVDRDQKKIYKHLDKLFVTLRGILEAAGVSRADVANLLRRGDQEIRLGLLSDEETQPLGPSHPTGEDKVRGGGGKLS